MRLLKNKHGVQLTMQTIIIAVLVIVVLIVLVLIFSKSARNFFIGTSGCISKNGQCYNECPAGWINHFAGNPECDSKNAGDLCCVREADILGTGDIT
nr:hypothetical protein [Nanoarchaeota archaeon]